MADTDAWHQVRSRLSHQLADLTEDEFLVLGEPQPEPGPRRGLLRRRPEPPPARYVQFRDDGEWLYGECVGATLFGGDWEVTEEQHQRLRASGWLAPGDKDPFEAPPSVPNYWVRLARSESSRMADMGTDALMLLGADPAVLEWRRDRA